MLWSNGSILINFFQEVYDEFMIYINLQDKYKFILLFKHKIMFKIVIKINKC